MAIKQAAGGRGKQRKKQPEPVQPAQEDQIAPRTGGRGKQRER